MSATFFVPRPCDNEGSVNVGQAFFYVRRRESGCCSSTKAAQGLAMAIQLSQLA